MRKKRVAILLHGLGPNGIDTLFANLANEWDYAMFDITYFLAVDPDNCQYWEQKVSEAGVRIIHLTDLDGKKILRWPKIFSKALKEYGPFDAVHVNMDMLNGINLVVAKLNKIPIRICHSHVSGHKLPDNKMKAFLKQIYLLIMRILMGCLSTKRIACSISAGSYFYGKKDYEVVVNGVDTVKFANAAVNKVPGNGKIRMLTVGRISYPKNPFFMADVVNEMYKRDNCVEFTWVGTGDLEQDIKQYVSGLEMKECVNFLGTRSDIAEIMASSDYFLLPSLYEGLGIVLIEAQASGLMCFVSDAVPPIVDCGRCKFISLEKGPSEWAQTLLTYIKSGENITLDTKKLNQFDIGNMARRLEQLYREEHSCNS